MRAWARIAVGVILAQISLVMLELEFLESKWSRLSFRVGVWFREKWVRVTVPEELAGRLMVRALAAYGMCAHKRSLCKCQVTSDFKHV